MSNILAMAAAAAAIAPNMNEAQKGGGGGDYTPPAEGIARARFVGYIETGIHERNVGPGKPPVQKPQVKLIFELSGPNHQPKVLDDGTKLPHRITVDENYSLNEKANFYKLFRRMNWKGTATHMSQLLGEAFLVTIKHKVTGEGDKKRTYANIRDDAGYTVQPPRYVDPLSNQTVEVPVDPPISALRLFVWNAPTELLKPMWDSLFIDGEYPARTDDKGNVTAPARTKNVLQEEIKAALNFKDSPIFQLLQTGGVELNLGAQVGNAAPPTTAAPTDEQAAATPSGAAPKVPNDDPLAAF